MALLEGIPPTQLVVCTIFLFISYLALQPWLFSPLRHIPGPWYAICTKWWLVYKTVKGVRAKTIHELHLKYGAWVRIAPNEVSTCDPEAIVPIYGANSAYVKTEFYTYQLRGQPELFTISDPKQHAKRRRELAHLFSMSTITEYELAIAKQIRTCMDYIAAEGKAGRPSNLYDWWHYLSMDITCELSFGLTFDMLRDGPHNEYIQDLYGSLRIEPIRWHFGRLNRYAAWAPLKFVRDAEACSVRAMDRGAKIVSEYMDSLKEDGDKKRRRKDLLQKMLDKGDEDGKDFSVEALNAEAAGFILAGSHTTSSSLTWIVWRILKDKRIYTKLMAELSQSLTSLPRDAVPPHQALEPLPYFNAIIKEGLRIDTAVPGSTPRYVPPGGSTIGSNQIHLPAHTIVSAQAYSTHRDPSVFPDPDSFLPERWLDETPEMRKLYIPFGADGPRKCIGIHLAWMELRVGLAALFWRFPGLSLAEREGDGEEVMELDEYWLANPKGQMLDVWAKEMR
ncbi:MAG: hypothetical protein Q9191_003339 [Dirinaria sp. TL-2023a]